MRQKIELVNYDDSTFQYRKRYEVTCDEECPKLVTVFSPVSIPQAV